MKNTSLFRRVLSVVLVVAMVLSVMVPWASAEQGKTPGNVKELTLTPTELGKQSSDKRDNSAADSAADKEAFEPMDVVRVSIVLEKPSTIDVGFKTDNIATNEAAKAYREGLRQDQRAMTAKIEKAIGGKLDVKWNLTLAANNISANVLYGQIETIKALDGVKDVFLENRYEPEKGTEDEPNNGSASYMIGSNITWANGYTGAGSKVAVIDTGADIEHQSFSGEGLEYALQQNAEAKGISYEEYLESLDLLTADKIDALKDQLNANIGSGAAVYRNTKVGYGYNYVDKNVTNITHVTDTQGEHGSHVSGISTANRFIEVDGEFVPALQAVGTQGVAPDAQLVVMKVFGSGGGAYDSDYMVAIEDAIVLGCDSANLSLGSGSPGFSFSNGYESVMNKLVENGTVVAFSAGNSGMWYDTPYNMPYSYLYIDDVNFATNGSPGSFTNALTVASVDNMGQTGMPLVVGDLHVFYSETSGYGNSPIATIAGEEYGYVFFDNFGADGDGNSLLAPYADEIAGKIVFCSRGTSSFYQKVNAAAEAGAVACVIYNNQPGVINMNLTGLTTDIPAVSITQADGDAIRSASEAVTAEDGTTYYTGTMSIAGELEVQIPEVSDTVSVSSFSSFGGPGSMVLKPEILAPGGSIYSVNGYNQLPASQGGGYSGGHDQYEVMSGTSMASPQVAGMAAVMGQYIRDNDLCEKTGLSQRQLINSLLMSTAHPVFDSDGEYWSVIRVGAGLGNIADATSAQSYILMDEDATMFPDSAKDGKVKAELGDDPDCTGEYSYSFTVYPIEGQKEFTLRTDIFTQWIAGNSPVGLLQDTGTILLGSETTYDINGETYEDGYTIGADVDMDGDTDADDAQAILDYLTGNLAEGDPFDDKVADVDGDGEITSYDAKLILESAATPTVQISGPTHVTVHIKIDEGDRDFLLNYFENGFYVEGYTFVEPVADTEGAMDVVHSIPIYGFCGNWSDPSMLDRTTAIDEAYGTGKVPYINANTNYLTMKDPDGVSSVYMGNPYMVEDEFPAERLAMNSQATISAYNYLNIRNAATIGFAIQDEEGKVLFAQATPTNKFSAYYYVNGGAWQNITPTNYNVGKKLSAAGLKEDDVVTVGFYVLPEYYGVLNAKNNGEVATTGSLDTEGFTAVLEAGLVGDGAGIKYTVKIDDTAPEVKGAFMDLITGDITVKTSDNNYIAYVGVLNKSGTKEYMAVVPEQEGPGEEIEVPLDLEGQTLPSEVVLLVGDYAGNEAAFKVNLGGSSTDENGGTMVGFVTADTTADPGSGNRAWEIDPENVWYNHNSGEFGGLSVFAELGIAVTAAEYVDGYVFMATDDGALYAAELAALDEPARVGSIYEAGYVYDMAFNYRDKQLYLLGENNELYRVDLITGALTKVAVLTLPGVTGEANRLACDDDGVFYTANNASGTSTKLFKFTLGGSAATEPEQPGESAYSWGFETGLDGWTSIDADGDGYEWTWNHNISSWFTTTPDFNTMAHTGTGAVLSGSYINTVGALSPDNWLVSPAFDLSDASDAQVSFYARSIDASYLENVIVYAGTSPDPEDMTAISSTITAPGSYTKYDASLADFVGEEEVYVAFRNNGTYDMYLVVIDDVEIVVADDGARVCDEILHGTPVDTHSTAPAQPVHDGAIYSFNFETDPESDGWVFTGVEDVNWFWSENNPGGYDYAEYAYEGNCFILSDSFIDNVGAYQADNWAVSPALTLPEDGARLSFYATQANNAYPEPFDLYIGTSADTGSMTLLQSNISPTGTATGPWTNYTFDLSDYAGQTVYIAFHDTNYDMYEVWIDMVEILGEGGEPGPEPPAPPVVVEDVTAELIGSGLGVYNRSTGGSMAWDHNKGILYLVSNWNTTQDYDHYLWIVDTETGAAARANSVQGTGTSSTNPSARLYGSVRGLFIVPGGSSIIQPTDEPTGLEVSPSELNLFVGQTAELEASVYPWTLTNKDVLWESADESIATVKDGVVTGVAVGETVITVSAAADPSMSLDVPVTVSVPPEAELRGIIWDENGKGQASVFNTNAPQEWTALATVGQFRWGARVDDLVYGSTNDTMYVFDADTYEVETLGGIVSMWIPSDADALPQDFRDAFAALGFAVGPVIGPNNNGTYLTMLDPEAGSLIYFDLSDTIFGSDPMATFCMGERGVYDDGDSYDDNAMIYYGATESGELYEYCLNHEGSIMWTDLGNIGIDLTGVSDATNEVWASMTYDAESEFLFLSLYNGADDFAHLYAIDKNDLSRVGETGDFNENVWPVTGLYQYEPATDLSLKVSPEELVLFEGETAELKIKVKLGETNEYTVVVADESVCTFEDGIVTAVKEGETTITITTVDTNEAGENLSVEVPVKVKGFKSVEGFVTAQVTDENGTRFTKISLDGAVVSKKGYDAPGDVISGGRAGDIYVADIGGTVNVFDALNFEPTLEWDEIDSSLYPTYPAMDFANYPTYLDESGLEQNDKVLMTLAVNWLVMPSYSGWNLSSYIPDLAAAAFVGVNETDDGTLLYEYYLLGADGSLYAIAIDFMGGRRTEPEKVFETGIVLGSQNDASMTFLATSKVNGDGSMDYDQAGLVIADNGTKKLYYLDFMAEDADDVVGLIGIMDVENVSGLAGPFDELDSVADIQGIEPFDPSLIVPPVYAWSFETEADLDGWTLDSRWSRTSATGVATESNPAKSYVLAATYDGSAAVDDKAITPVMDFSELDNATLSFWVMKNSTYWNENYSVYAGTSPNFDEMTEIVPETAAVNEWVNVTVDMADFCGEEEVYIAFRHTAAADQFKLYIDAIEITTEKEDGGDSVVNPAAAMAYEYVPMKAAAKDLGLGFGRADAAQFETGVEIAKVGEAVNAANGGTDAIKGELVSDMRAAADNTSFGDGKYKIELSDTKASTNGLIEIVYDPEILSFEGALSNLELYSVKDNDGVIRFAYASTEEIAANTVLATLSFSAKVEKPCSEITVTTLERGEDVAVDEDELLIHICPCAHFTDMPEYGTPEHEAIDWAYVNGYTGGVDVDKFGTGMDMTRGQAVVFLWAVSGKPSVAGVENPFTDVADGIWYHDAVLWAVQKGITGGTGDGKFSPDMNMTRNQLMVFLYAMAEKPSVEELENPYTDTEGTWWRDAATWGYDFGIERGEGGVFDGAGRCPREMFVLWLYRYMVEEARLTD